MAIAREDDDDVDSGYGNSDDDVDSDDVGIIHDEDVDSGDGNSRRRRWR